MNSLKMIFAVFAAVVYSLTAGIATALLLTIVLVLGLGFDPDSVRYVIRGFDFVVLFTVFTYVLGY